MSKGGTCNICGAPSGWMADAVIMKKHQISYFQCSQCGFVQTEAPYWLDEAYSSAIIDSDIGLLSRNILNADITKLLIGLFLNPDGMYLDYGGGYGTLTRLMRDAGYHFRHYDPFCSNLFAKGAEADLSTGERYELITAFELFEHFAHPIVELNRLLAYSDSILFSTELLPAHRPLPSEWWYYALDGGQHISIYTLDSLFHLAKRFGLNLYSNGTSLHLLTPRSISPSVFEIACNADLARSMGLHFNRPSLTQADFERIVASRLT